MTTTGLHTLSVSWVLVNGDLRKWLQLTDAFLCDIGFNTLEKAPPSKVADFVKSQGGHTVITKVLERAYLQF